MIFGSTYSPLGRGQIDKRLQSETFGDQGWVPVHEHFPNHETHLCLVANLPVEDALETLSSQEESFSSKSLNYWTKNIIAPNDILLSMI